MRRAVAILLCLLLVGAASAAPNVLTQNPNVDNGVNQVPLAIQATAGNVVNNPVFVDFDTVDNTLVPDSGNAAATTIRSLASPGTQVNHAPYQVVAYPATGISPQQWYSQLQSQIAILSLPHGVGDAANHQLPAAASIVSSPNSLDGTTGWGSDLGISASYLGLDTTSDSNDAGIMAGFEAALLYNHSTWNAFDAHAALRITASNWATGYNHTSFGFGTVNWTNANAAATLYLQAPEMAVQNNSFWAKFTLYPFRQTRRSKEVIYSVSASYVWPVKNEYTTADITASGATLLYTSNGTDVTPVFSYAPGVSGTVTFVAFTTDGSGNYSRVDEFSKISQTFTVSVTCH